VKYLANENIPLAAVRVLRGSGFDITGIAETNPGAGDRQVLAQAEREGRVLITFDKDFAELVFRESSPHSMGVILLRFKPRSPQFITESLRTLLSSERAWERQFSVVGENRIRMVPLPGK
jgi:predicted nuclease of predicted toxin-antitoxin system